MKKIGIAIDKWKLKIFKKHLGNAGYEFKKKPGITPDTLCLMIKADTEQEIASIAQAANNECARSKLN